jgi:hypothetical protein
MIFYWIRDRVRQGQFQVYWGKGSRNRADYFTKHHPASHHKAVRSAYVYSPDGPSKNYFDCLADTEDAESAPHVAIATADTISEKSLDSGEGVLISR